ncbi:tail fiber domain-containing protein [Stenotrophomonas sp. C1657]|uniref:tail fiber domain-containing protein n=1 Tax=Stenotrophomonas sp. C1657 TaxID=3077844 RepID=UPI00293C5359|nr:tail fiber domain-containing protein [Stenotrophomonas sp. C1657]MDV3513153.1 tail fiber domain-containing protein [Stenotrophomonas sp. C1657]
MRLKITDAGFAKLVNPPNTGTNAVLITQIGLTSTAFAPSGDLSALPGEIKRVATFGGQAVGDDTLHVTIRDDSATAYSLRGFGLYLADGTLFATYGQTDPIMEKSAASMLLLATDARFTDVDITQIQFGNAEFIYPPATTEVLGVVELATNTEAEDAADTQRAVTPRGLRAFTDKRFGAAAPTALARTLLSAATTAGARTALELKGAALKDTGHGNGLDADTLDGKHASDFALAGDFATVGHKHVIADVTGLQTALDGKASKGTNSFTDQQFVGGTYPLVGFGAQGAEQSFIGGWANAGLWRVWSTDRAASSEITIKHGDTPRWNGAAMWHAGNFVPESKMDKTGGTFSGAVIVKDNMLRLSGWGNSASDGVMYFGSGDSYVFKSGAVFSFKNVEGGFTATMSSGGNIWTSGNFDPSTKLSRTGGDMTGALRMWGNTVRLASFDDNRDTPCVEIGSGVNNAADRNGFVINRNSTGALCLWGRNGAVRLDIGATASASVLKGGLRTDGDLNVNSSASTNSDNSTFIRFTEANTSGETRRLDVYLDGPGGIPSQQAITWRAIVLDRFKFVAGSTSFSGSVSAAGGFDIGSSRKLKAIDGPVPYGLAAVERMELATGHYKPEYNSDGRRRLFFVAEQLAELVPEAVDLEGVEFNGERVASIKLDQLLPVMAKAIQELAAEVRALKAER